MPEKCGRHGGCDNEATPEPHVCPFLADVHDDREFKCNCCAECEQECGDSI